MISNAPAPNHKQSDFGVRIASQVWDGTLGQKS